MTSTLHHLRTATARESRGLSYYALRHDPTFRVRTLIRDLLDEEHRAPRIRCPLCAWQPAGWCR